MNKLRIVLMGNGHVEYEFEMEMELPRIGEIISYRGEHYNVRFIQYVIEDLYVNDKPNFKFQNYILVTAIREVAEDKKR